MFAYACAKTNFIEKIQVNFTNGKENRIVMQNFFIYIHVKQ